MPSIALNCVALDSTQAIGVERFARTVLGAANFGDNPVNCFTRSSEKSVEALLGRDFVKRHQRLGHRGLPVSWTPLRILAEMFWLPFFSRRAEVVLSINNFGPLWGQRGQRRLVVVHDVWFMDAGYEGGTLAKWVFYCLLSLQLRRSSRVITVSDFSRREICRHFGLASESVLVVDCCLGECVAPSPPGKRELPPFLLLVGSSRPNKNVLRALDGFARYRADHPGADTRLVVVGRYPPDWVADARRRHPELTDDVLEWRGYVSDQELAELYGRSHGLVFVSLYEGFGIPAMEALLRGRPVLLSHGTATAEIAGDLAITVDGRNPDDIARGMAALVDGEVTVDGATFQAFRDRHMRCDATAVELARLVLSG